MAGNYPTFTVADAKYYCGVTDSDLFNDDMKSDSMSAEVFDDDLSSCMDKTYE